MPIYKTNRKKDGKQQYRVRVNYTDGAGEYCQKEQTCYGYPEAQELEHQMQLQYVGTSNLGEMLLSDFFEIYKTQKIHEVRETTYNKMTSILDRHVMPYLGSAPLIDLNERALMQWKAAINELGLSITMRKKIYGEFHALLNFAVKMKYIHENSMNAIGNFKDAYFELPADKLRFFTPEQFKAFATVANEDSMGFYRRSIFVFFCLAYYTGMRKGEIHALRWEDIEGEIIHVRRSISQKIKGKKIVETPPKNKSSYRNLQIPEPLRDILVQYQALQRLQFPQKWNNGFRVCYGEKCISDTAISNYNIKWARAAGLEPIRIHDFRHSHASLLANEGINIQEIARRLGHSNVQITWNRYSHLYPREEERAITVLNQVKVL